MDVFDRPDMKYNTIIPLNALIACVYEEFLKLVCCCIAMQCCKELRINS